ncbi:anaerobic ribonucleoside-triphosphate reductase activating protein [Campylobacter sp. CNRCH_2016_0050h]|uniref:anaerobic ribonucleoside-triphosphate reductase activating protein n=1 Tax=Campylobacter sp. CNRCH_2016_0050h TaxID=2911608 RepID=UPI0021E6B917|nr:anaerobic ribonucleoside-triphosphate reductase activating protein [Campylobacter sp. CNRCH_2016_0050h]MCV3456454.1 anaerobic ribonucleoside-triphosphate reductase activating protein [Campylobacter sp. CNRCH_2016_0050h]
MQELNTIFLRLAGVIKESIVDGYGLRYVIFTQGCPHHCKGCHNPQTHDFNKGYLQDLASLCDDICKNPLLQGVTFSGGEPFMQAKNLSILAKHIKALGLDLTIYTGFTYEELLQEQAMKELLILADVLIDGKFILEQKDLSLKFKGSKNQRIIDVAKSLEQGKVILFEK